LNKKIYVLLILIGIITFIIMSCNDTKTTSDLLCQDSKLIYNIIEYKYCDSYTTEGEFYDEISGYDKGYYITYPQIENLTNKELETLINEKMNDIAMSRIFDNMSPERDNVKTTYTITLSTDKYFSVRFILSSFVEHQAYPNVSIKTFTIDLQTGEILTLKDIIHINESFKSSFFNIFKNVKNDYEFINDTEYSHFEETINEYIGGLIDYELLLTCDDESNVDVHSCITADSLIICFSVPHSSGSYALYAAKFSELIDWLILGKTKIIIK